MIRIIKSGPLVIIILLIIAAIYSFATKPTPPAIHQKTDSNGEKIIYASLEFYDHGTTYSFLPYAHYNAITRFDENADFLLILGGITYRFNLKDFDNPKFQFTYEGTQYTVWSKNNQIYMYNYSLLGVFQKKAPICDYPENSYFCVIQIKGLDGVAVVLLTPIEESDESNIEIYIWYDGVWSKGNFAMPDGSINDLFQGYARRQFDPTSAIPLASAGELELCWIDLDGSATLYDIVFDDGTLYLEESKFVFVSEELLCYWKF